MTDPTLQNVLEGRRKWLETFSPPGAQGVAKDAARGVVDSFQGRDNADIYTEMKSHYLNLLLRSLKLREKSGKPSNSIEQIDYLIKQLAQLEDWKAAGYPD